MNSCTLCQYRSRLPLTRSMSFSPCCCRWFCSLILQLANLLSFPCVISRLQLTDMRYDRRLLYLRLYAARTIHFCAISPLSAVNRLPVVWKTKVIVGHCSDSQTLSHAFSRLTHGSGIFLSGNSEVCLSMTFRETCAQADAENETIKPSCSMFLRIIRSSHLQ